MAELEIIDAEIVPQQLRSQQLASALGKHHHDNISDGSIEGLSSLSLSPVYTQAEREAALRLLVPSTHDVVLGAGWVDSQDSIPASFSEDSSDDNDTFRRASSASSSSTFSTPSTPPRSTTSPLNHHTSYPSASNLTDALLVRSCSQGWTLSFELTPTSPIPQPTSPDHILVRNDAVGLNPVDWKSVSYNFGIPAFPWILGRDIAGTIIQPPVENQEGWKVGDRVWTCADSREITAGGYQRFSVHKKGTLAKIPDRVKDEEAATLGTGLITAAVALFAFFKLPFATIASKDVDEGLTERLEKVKLDDGEQEDGRDWILIYGGGAVTGIYAAQLASISNLRIISIASPSNFGYLRSIGVTVCIDRHQPPAAILSSILSTLASHGGKLRYAMDCVSSSTSDLCLEALQQTAPTGSEQGELICLAGNPKAEVKQVKVHKISFSSTFYHPNGEFARSVLDYVTQLLDSRRLQPCRPEILPDGLAGIREGKAPRARKLVVKVKDTPAADVTHLGVRTELGWNGVV
ncbi:uncharacterized protein UTRI_03781_B [Ustilago trichophora]|uniref:Alcohol dehydrogenase-like N-terminal domain-containing protein n=1 Tax=Ustilago trichophora TaxID=86804 RepID=A0A5C3E2L1_9BASI|nr:uncharacterized protein UTRI_03781_B [Ustilago trichophora]